MYNRATYLEIMSMISNSFKKIFQIATNFLIAASGQRNGTFSFSVTLKYKKIKSEEAFSSFLVRNVVAMWKYKMSVQRQC